MIQALATIAALSILGGCAELPRRAFPSSGVALQDPDGFERAAPPPEATQSQSGPSQAAGDLGVELTVPVGLGFTAGPTTLLLSGAVERKVDERWSIGPAVQLGVGHDRALMSLAAQARYELPVTEMPKRLSSFVQGGVGIVYLDEEQGSSNVDDLGLLVNVGASLRYDMRRGYSLGSSMMLNFVPTELINERLYFSWDVVQIVLRF